MSRVHVKKKHLSLFFLIDLLVLLYRKTTIEKHICVVKPSRVAVKDTTESELLKKELESLRGQIKMREKEVDLAQLSLNLHKKELERVRQRKRSRVS